jgi:hypothetical protein
LLHVRVGLVGGFEQQQQEFNNKAKQKSTQK